ncbi:hypothetical protein niasHS_013281 [Heterodera schachtii]|uniref:Uncharacterized protein n=1 Tax=Heterodera schachtii TaxID=97005 RepID=A0ABD2IDU8_HETSC
MASEIPPSSLPLPNSSQNIYPLTTQSETAAVCFSSTSSPKLAVYNNNHSVNDQQRCSPSVNNSNTKRVLSRSGTPSSSNASLHLKIGTPKSTAGDVYDFHSSPEEDGVPTTGPGFFFSSAPNAGVIQSKESLQPPQKRIKTAILAKKLLAAAADSNLIDSIGVGQSNGNGTPKRTSSEEHFGNENLSIFDETQRETEGIGEGLFEEDEEETEEQEERELDERPDGGRTDAATSVVVQEQKKVPPLRISLLKTPSEEGTEVSSAQISPPLRRNRGGSRVGGRRQGHGTKKDDLQRITRSRVRQIATNANSEDGISLLGRKRRFQPAGASSGLLEEEEDAMSGTAEMAESGEAENAAEEEQLNSNNEDQRSEEDSRHSGTGNRTTEGTDAPQQQRQSLAASVLSKNSFEQSATFEAMIRERWALQYREYLSKVTERMENANLNAQKTDQSQEGVAENNLIGSAVTKEWPELLQKLYAEQSNRSSEMAEAHRQDRERIRTMMQREVTKVAEAQGQTGERQTLFITAVSMLRDSECYDPTVFAAGTSPAKKHQTPSLAQIQQKFSYLVNTTKNRHAMEAHTLAENHKSEWNRALGKIARENERQQMLKGVANGKQRLVQLPLECCSESVVPVVKLVDIPLISFQNE